MDRRECKMQVQAVLREMWGSIRSVELYKMFYGNVGGQLCATDSWKNTKLFLDMVLFSLGCLWQVMIKLEPLVVMIGDKVIEQEHIILF